MSSQSYPVLVSGHLLRSRYRIDRLLGQGGMGVVYLARDEESGEQRAIKEVQMDDVSPTRRAAVARQFGLEARILTTLEHPNLPRVYDFFEERHQYYLVMDFIEGNTLADHRLIIPNLPEDQVLGWLSQLCQVLRYLHTHRPPVIFRDLKPSNVMLTRTGQIKLIDFGIAKLVDPDLGSNTLSSARGMVSPGYAAPEQYAGGTDAQSDLYSLGATAYFLLTGQRPPDSLEMVTGASQLFPIRSLRPEISEGVAQAVEWMMQVRRQERPRSVVEVMQALGLATPAPVPPTDGPPAPIDTVHRPLARVARTDLVHPGPDLTHPEGDAHPRRRRPLPRPPRRLAVALLAVFLGLTSWWGYRHFLAVGTVSVQTVPPGAQVLVSGRPVGTTPMQMQLRPGVWAVAVRCEGYAPDTEMVMMDPNAEAQLSFSMRRLSAAEEAAPPSRDPAIYYPPSKAPPPPLLRGQSERLQGVEFSVPDGWTVDSREEHAGQGVVVMAQGDGQAIPRKEARLSVGPDRRTMLAVDQAERARLEREGWVVVARRLEPQALFLRFESRRGGVSGRGFLAARTLPQGRMVQLEFTCQPCQEAFLLIRMADLLRTNVGFKF